MTVIRKSEYYRKANQRFNPSSIDVHNWRFIWYSKDLKINGRTSNGTVIQLQEEMVFIPLRTIEDIHKINSIKGPVDQFFEILISYYRAPYCFKCHGIGKYDWIEETTMVHNDNSKSRFIRDMSLFYTHPQSENHVFAKTMLHEGESYCPRCNGFGIELDGRWRPFKLRGLKKRLIEHKTYER